MPGGIEPVLMMDGALYRWARLNGTGVPLETENGLILPTYLPEGYEAAGDPSPRTRRKRIFKCRRASPPAALCSQIRTGPW